MLEPRSKNSFTMVKLGIFAPNYKWIPGEPLRKIVADVEEKKLVRLRIKSITIVKNLKWIAELDLTILLISLLTLAFSRSERSRGRSPVRMFNHGNRNCVALQPLRLQVNHQNGLETSPGFFTFPHFKIPLQIMWKVLSTQEWPKLSHKASSQRISLERHLDEED